MHQESYSADEIRRLLNALRPPYRLMAQLQWELGIRWVSVERLRVRDIGPRLHISGKGGTEQWLPISRVTRNALFRWTRTLPIRAPLFDRTYSAYRSALIKAGAAAGLPYGGSHALRRSFARRRLGELMRQGLTEREARRIIAKEMGHGDKRGRITLAYHAGVDV
ncbi:MAG: tyrosine-type recombinase/integrase [Firmicutes bacterium]|nr:tyrosine-type recombinase/integrase [Bacillota bacterium]